MRIVNAITRVVVFENAEDTDGGHQTTFGQFAVDNAEGLDADRLAVIAADLATDGRHFGNEGAGGCWRIEVAA